MTGINNVSSSRLLAGYLQSTSNDDLDAKTIFKNLSIDLGGDGKTITKDKLDSYIEAAASKTVKVSDETLNGLKQIQSQWDKISNGSDSISYANMANRKSLLTSMDSADKKSSVDVEALAASQMDVDSYLVASALGFSAYDTEDSGSNLTSMLRSLLTGTTDENDDSNADLIATLTNLIADLKSNKSVDVEA